MCHIVYPFVPSARLATVHCSESLIWFKASGFWYTILTGSSPKLFWGILCLRDHAGIVPEDQYFHELQQDLDGVDARVGPPKTQLLIWVLAMQVRSSHWGRLPRVWLVGSAALYACPQGRTLDPNKVLNKSLVWMSPLSPVAAWSRGTNNLARDLGSLHGLR